MKLIELELRGPPSIGGVEKHVFEVGRRFQRETCDVEIWSSDLLDFRGKIDPHSERVFRKIKVRKFRSFLIPIMVVKIMQNFCPFVCEIVYPKMLLEFLRIRKSEIVAHCHSFPSFHSYLSLLFHKKFRRVIVTPHFDGDDLVNYVSYIHGKLAFAILRSFVNRHHNVFLTAITKREANLYVSLLGFDQNKVKVIPNGVDLKEFDTIADDYVSKTEKQYNIEQMFNVLFVGRVAEIKGLDLLINAVAKMETEGIKLIIAGPDFGSLQMLQRLCDNLGVRDKVIFTGELSRRKLCTLFKICDVFVLPSYGGEAFGIVLAEAMACSKPVIGSRTGGIPEIIKEGKNGFLFEVGSELQLRDSITRLYNNPKLRKRMGENGRKKVEDTFTWDKVAEKYRKLFMEQ